MNARHITDSPLMQSDVNTELKRAEEEIMRLLREAPFPGATTLPPLSLLPGRAELQLGTEAE